MVELAIENVEQKYDEENEEVVSYVLEYKIPQYENLYRTEPIPADEFDQERAKELVMQEASPLITAPEVSVTFPSERSEADSLSSSGTSWLSRRQVVLGGVGTGLVGLVGGWMFSRQNKDDDSTVSISTFTPEDATATPQTDVVSSEEGTETESSTPTANSGTTAENVFDNFEDEQISWEILTGDPAVLSISSEAVKGEQSLHFERASINTSSRIHKDLPEAVTLESISYWFKYQSENDNQFNMKFISSQKNTIMEIREYFTGVHYNYSNSSPERVAPVSQQEWYRVILEKIDFDSQTLDIVVKDASGITVGQSSDVEFRNEAKDFKRIQIANGLSNNGGADPLWIDYITYRT